MRHVIFITLIALILTGCFKDEVDVAAMNNNPFDPAYQGEAVFVLVGTYTQLVNIGGSSVLRQVIEFTVREDLFGSPATYSVEMTDQQNDWTEVLNPDPVGSNRFRYYRQPAQGQSICLELRLYNNLSGARPETICATL